MPYIETNLENILNIKKNIIVMNSGLNPSKFDFGVETHNFWEFEYVTEGTFEIYHGEKKYILKQGDILFHKPNQPHESVGIPPYNAVGFINISFICNSNAIKCFEDYHAPLSPKSKKLLTDLITEGENAFNPVADGPIARSVLKDTAPLGAQQAYRIKLELFLINLIREYYEANPNKLFTSKKEYDKNLFDGIVKYLSDNIYSTISLDEISNKFNYSTAYLCKFFKKSSGTTIVNYYNELKIKESLSFFSEQNKTVTEVAEILGFTSRYYFAKAFKKVMGISPSEYKKINR